MTKKKLWIAVGLGVAVLLPTLGCLGLFTLGTVPAPDREEEKYKAGFERIQIGMTRKDVKTIFGNDGIAIGTLDPKTNKWREDRYWGPFNVAYDDEGKVVDKYEVLRNESAVQNLFRWHHYLLVER